MARAAGFTEHLVSEAQGSVVPPHSFSGVGNDSALAQAEQLAPVAVIIRAEDEADAIRLANAAEYGLSSAIFTHDVARGMEAGAADQTGDDLC
ncbi:aldehyde dehydrogenase family protein [Sphingomonas sp. 22176]|uniref:aldehyde dehydrogenase family protein n=1 Tax=Sphingomonas sp. 22176 TaxID=3453884 RepID=UPI003F86E03C